MLLELFIQMLEVRLERLKVVSWLPVEFQIVFGLFHVPMHLFLKAANQGALAFLACGALTHLYNKY